MIKLPDKKYFRVKEVADFFSINHKTFYGYINSGIVPAKKFQGVLLITRDDIVALESKLENLDIDDRSVKTF